MKVKTVAYVAGLAGWLFACQPEKPVPAFRQPLVPAVFGTAIPEPARNRMTPVGIALGKKLFFDPALSANNRVACATCHQPDKAFSDGLPLSDKGISGKKLSRHVPALINLAWQPAFFWDGGVKDLESLPVAPLTHPDEMGQNLKALCHKLQHTPDYPVLFRQAFGSDSITTQHILQALAQFQRTLVSGNSKYDAFCQHKTAFSAEERLGLTLFEKHCQTCHPPPFFTDFGFHNNGLDASFTDLSENRLRQGRLRITDKPADAGTYKTPTLRSLSLTAPYMHDGRLPDLQAVIRHYSDSIQPSVTLSYLIPRQGFGFTTPEKKALLAFLKTL